MTRPRHSTVQLWNVLLVTALVIEQVAPETKEEQILARHFSCTSLLQSAFLVICALDLIICILVTVMAKLTDSLVKVKFIGLHICSQLASTGLWTWSFVPLLAKQIDICLSGFDVTFTINQFITNWIFIIPHC